MAVRLDKRYYKIGEVARLAGVETYVIRYWEGEFPQLKPLRAGSRQRLYSRRDVGLIQAIRRLLYDEKYTIAGAKRKMAEEEPPEVAGLAPVEDLRDADLFEPPPDDLPDPPRDDEPSPPPDRPAGRAELLAAAAGELRRIVKLLS